MHLFDTDEAEYQIQVYTIEILYLLYCWNPNFPVSAYKSCKNI